MHKLPLLIHPFNGPFSRTTCVSRHRKGKFSQDLHEARDDEVLEWQWHQLDHMKTICKPRSRQITTPTPTHAHTHLTALLSGTTRVGRYQKGKTDLDFTEARDSEWQWHQLGHMQVCTLL